MVEAVINSSMKRIGPHSRPGKLAIVDGRSAEARRMKEVRAELTEHLGGKPSVAHRLLIDRVAMLLLRMELMDKEALGGTAMTERDQRAYLGWHNAVSRSLRHLGLNGAPGKAAPSLAEYIAARAGGQEAVQ